MKALTIILLLVSSFLYGQELPTNERGIVEYQKIIQTDKKQSEAHTVAVKWLARNYNSLPDVLKLEMQDQIIIKGRIPVQVGMHSCYVDHSLTIDFKDYKVRITMNQLSFISSDGRSHSMNGINGKWLWKKIIRESDEAIKETISALEYAFTSPVANNDDW